MRWGGTRKGGKKGRLKRCTVRLIGVMGCGLLDCLLDAFVGCAKRSDTILCSVV